MAFFFGSLIAASRYGRLLVIFSYAREKSLPWQVVECVAHFNYVGQPVVPDRADDGANAETVVIVPCYFLFQFHINLLIPATGVLHLRGYHPVF